MKNYSEAKNMQELAKILKLPHGKADKIEMRTNLAVAIKRTVENMGLTHAEVAKQTGFGRTVITAILNGNTTHISTDRLIEIAQNLGLRVTLKIA